MAVETERVKEWLSRYASAMREVALLRIRADNMRQRAMSPASSNIDGMPRVPGFSGDKYGGMIGEAKALKMKLQRKSNRRLRCIERLTARYGRSAECVERSGDLSYRRVTLIA